MTTNNKQFLALSGGVGGAKLALGLSKLLSPEQLTIVANTGDDFEHLGLTICPDLDTLMYTLADINNKEQGWGLAGETWQTLDALGTLGAPTWFQLGDRDIATHLQRSDRLRQGHSLSEITHDLCQQLGVQHRILPMSDDRVSTKVTTTKHEVLDFQHYFVRERCKPSVKGIHFEGIETAQAQPELMSLLNSSDLAATIICPSNPFVSVAPILALKQLRQAMSQPHAPVIAISPIIAGAAVKGPAAKIIADLGYTPSALAVAQYYCEHYKGFIDGMVIDQADADQADEIEQLGITTLVAPILMRNLDDKINLAQTVLDFSAQMNAQGND